MAHETRESLCNEYVPPSVKTRNHGDFKTDFFAMLMAASMYRRLTPHRLRASSWNRSYFLCLPNSAPFVVMVHTTCFGSFIKDLWDLQVRDRIHISCKLLAKTGGFGLHRDKTFVVVFFQLLGQCPCRMSVPLCLTGHIKGINIKTVAYLHQRQIDYKFIVYVYLPDRRPF